jgi:hypothetical protein
MDFSTNELCEIIRHALGNCETVFISQLNLAMTLAVHKYHRSGRMKRSIATRKK